MNSLLVTLLAAAFAVAQDPKPGNPPAAVKPPVAKPEKPEAPGKVAAVQFDKDGWPVVHEPQGRTPTPPAAPAAETKAPKALAGRDAGAPAAGAPPGSVGEARTPAVPALASGMELGSPLLEVFQSVRTPGAFKALGGLSVWWRLTIYGAQGEVIGMRELTQIADCAFAERDRLEYQDRIYGRSGASVFAERNGMPWPTLSEQAGHELAFFGLQLRLPWCFGDGAAFACVARDTAERAGEKLVRVVVERRPPASQDLVGPESDPRPRDRYELLYEPTTGQLREFVHRFASSLQTRRVLLEDWREVVDGHDVRMPRRRVYVDDALRQTTTLEILRIEPLRVTERDFRLR